MLSARLIAGPRALVLTAGLGTRLQPLTLRRAKAAAPVDGEPLAGAPSAAGRPTACAISSSTSITARNRSPRPSATAPISASASAIRGSRPCSGRPAARATRCRCCRRERAFLIVNGDTLTDVDTGGDDRSHRRTRRARDDGADPEPRPRPLRRRSSTDDGGVTDSRVRRRAPRGRLLHFIGPQVARRRRSPP